MSISDDPSQARPQHSTTSPQMLDALLAKRLTLDNNTVSEVVNELQVLLM